MTGSPTSTKIPPTTKKPDNPKPGSGSRRRRAADVTLAPATTEKPASVAEDIKTITEGPIAVCMNINCTVCL